MGLCHVEICWRTCEMGQAIVLNVIIFIWIYIDIVTKKARDSQTGCFVEPWAYCFKPTANGTDDSAFGHNTPTTPVIVWIVNGTGCAYVS